MEESDNVRQRRFLVITTPGRRRLGGETSGTLFLECVVRSRTCTSALSALLVRYEIGKTFLSTNRNSLFHFAKIPTNAVWLSLWQAFHAVQWVHICINLSILSFLTQVIKILLKFKACKVVKCLLSPRIMAIRNSNCSQFFPSQNLTYVKKR